MTGQVPYYWIFQNIGWYLYWWKFLQVIFCYWSDTCAVQLIRGLFHLDISFILWFGIIRFLFCVFWSLHSWISQRCRRQGFRRCHSGWCTHILEPFLNISLRSAYYIDETLWYKAKFIVLGLLSFTAGLLGFPNYQMPD